MGKKGSWFSAIKRIFICKSEDKPVNEAENKTWKKNKGRGRLKHGSFIPLFREPSSIEKILGEVDQQNLFIKQSEAPQPSISARPLAPSVASPPKTPAASPPRQTTATSPPRPREATSPILIETTHRPEPTLQQQHLSATRIQAAYRGHMARKNVRALTGLVRLQGVVRGQNVKRQTVNAMKRMQLLVRVQTQIQSRRMQMLENQALKRQADKNHKQLDTSLANKPSEVGDGNWDDSVITKEEREARTQKKMKAAINREKAKAYASSHQPWKPTPKSSIMDMRSGGYPWWWNRLERQLPSDTQPTPDHKQPDSPMSSRSMAPSRTRQQMTPSRTLPSNHLLKYRVNKTRGGSPYSMKDDDSLRSCPAFSAPHYMSPTFSAKAKAKARLNPKDSAPSTPGSETSKRRFSFPLTPDSNNGPYKWNKGSVAGSSRNINKATSSIGDLSVDSAVSMPATFGRKPFNRFV